MNRLRERLSQYWLNIQGSLSPWLKEELGELIEKQQQLVMTLELVQVEAFPSTLYGLPGRPPAERTAMARAFVAKMVYAMPTTRVLIDRLKSDQKLRRICGWKRKNDIPREWIVPRVFAEFAESQLPERVHEALIHKSYAGEIVGHISRDSMAIEAREKLIKKDSKDPEEKKPKKRGRPKKRNERSKEPTRLERQIAGMSLTAMLEDLPKACDVETKKDSKGYKRSWTGYKLHIDAADGGIPISCILTSASSHDSQSAIPLATMTSWRVTNLYDLMDSAYDASQIHDYSRPLDHVPLIDIHPRRNKVLRKNWRTKERGAKPSATRQPKRIDA